jgi:hypothetical protein
MVNVNIGPVGTIRGSGEPIPEAGSRHRQASPPPQFAREMHGPAKDFNACEAEQHLGHP